jgi:flagella basal body P-ring formation protein FlgA
MRTLSLVLLALLVAGPAFPATGMRIVVPVRDIGRGETIAESDLSYQVVAPESVMSNTATSMDALVGMQTRRVLHQGESVRNDDVRHPILVTRGSTVTMSFEAPGITLTAVGRAMSEGGVGDTVTVLNPASYRQISAVVTGPGIVRAQNANAVPGSHPRFADAQP